MPVIFKLKRLMLKHFMNLRWHSLLLAIVFYLAATWILLAASGEADLVNRQDFLYWVVVTASTVGYGDLSPSTVAGKYVTALFVIPLGLGLFGLAVGRLAAFVSFQWRKGVQGLKPIHYKNHILVIGWNENRTLQLIKLLLRDIEYAEEQTKVALCVRADIENPMPEDIGFVKVTSFSSDDDMARAAIADAGCIIIDNPDDDITMTTALYCASKNSSAHIIAYFQEEKLGELLKSHCPNIECMPSVGVEMIAKSAVDPGSSALHQELLDVDKGMTQYSVVYQGQADAQVRDLFLFLKETYQATLIGVTCREGESLQLNPDLADVVPVGARLYYIADERINRINWER
jgi:voltage-gated potassium channel